MNACFLYSLKPKMGKILFLVNVDRNMQEALSSIVSYFNTPREKNTDVQYNAKLGASYLNSEITKDYYLKHFQSTYRVKYSRIVKKEIWGRERFYLQMVVEGHPIPKRHKDGRFRHELGKGKVGNY